MVGCIAGALFLLSFLCLSPDISQVLHQNVLAIFLSRQKVNLQGNLNDLVLHKLNFYVTVLL